MSRVNGQPRKTLADQIDRLDGILDGLGEALTEAVADAVKEAVRAAVANPAGRPEPVQPAAETRDPASPLTWPDRLWRVVGRTAALEHDVVPWAFRKYRAACGWVRATGEGMRNRITCTADRGATMLITAAAASRAQIHDYWRRHGPAVLATAVVLLAGAAWLLGSPFVAGLACGGLALALALGTREGLIGRHRPGGRWPESPGDCVHQLSAGGPDSWI
jgi:hypothetical protein